MVEEMRILGINPERCNVCKECMKECPFELFIPYVTEYSIGIIYSDPYDKCTGCSNCIDVCSQKAIEFEDVETYEFNAHIK
jgi:NAD-dependent dihydropyrimidine dehydrogenase PreA subunit